MHNQKQANERTSPGWRAKPCLPKAFSLPECLLLLALICAGIAIGGHLSQLHSVMRIMGVLGLWIILQNGRRLSFQNINAGFLCLLCLPLYILLTPGCLFSDARIGWQMCAMVCAGIAGSFLSLPALPFLFLPITCTLAASAAMLPFHGVSLFSPDNRLQLFQSGPNDLAELLAYCILFFTVYAQEHAVLKKYLAMAISGLCFFLLLLTTSRTSLLALLLTISILYFFCIKNIKRLLAVILTLSCFAILAYTILPDSQKERVHEIINISNARNIRTRGNVWHVTMQGILEMPAFGRGYASFKPYYERFVQNHYAELQKKFPGYVEDYADHAHNIILHFLYSYGILGSVIFIFLIGYTLALAIRKKNKFIISLLLYTLISGIAEVYIQRSNAIAIIFFPLGLFYGKDLQYPSSSEESSQAAS